MAEITFTPEQQALINQVAQNALAPGQTFTPGSSSPQDAGVDWNAISNLVSKGYKANPDGTITGPDGTLYAGSTQGPGKALTPVSRSSSASPQQPTDSAVLNDAKGVIANELVGWGLGDLTDWAWNELTSGKSPDQVLFDLRQTPTYKQSIFGRINSARQTAGKPVMSEAQILDYKTSALQLNRQAGLPDGFLNDDRIVHLASNDVSIAELDKRVNTEYVNAAQALPVVRDTLAAYYGIPSSQITNGDLAAYYLDPEHSVPLLDRQYKAAAIGAQGSLTGFGPVDKATAEQLAALGISESQAQQGFSDVAHYRQLYTGLPGQQPITDQNTALQAEFFKDAGALQRMQLAVDTAKSPFNANQKFTDSGAGSGVGNAATV